MVRKPPPARRTAIVNSTTLKSLAVGLCFGLGAAATGCSAEGAGAAGGEPAGPSPTSESVGDPADMGSVGMQLTLPGGAQVSSVNWVISGPNDAATVVKSGSVDVHASGGVSVLVGDILAGAGYHVALSAQATDGGLSCAGTAAFAVHAHAITQVAVQMACNIAPSGGQTTVNGTSFDCAAWNSVAASPVETAIGTPVALMASATGPVPTNLTYAWSAPSGFFGSATAASTSFTCTAPGPVTVTLVVGDGPVPAGSTCNPALDTDTVTITCTGTVPPPSSAPALPWGGVVALALGMLGLGAWTRRPRGGASPA
jgi:hypothetical protein